MISLPPGSWDIVPSSRCARDDKSIVPVDHASAEAFLRECLFDFMTMSRLREVLAMTDPVFLMTDDTVVDLLASRLTAGQLVLRNLRAEKDEGQGGGSSSGKGAAIVEDAPAGSDPEIEGLQLAAVAKKAAYELKKKHPTVVFTSGRRNKQEQASAMAENVVLNRNWIKETYAMSAARDACQKWVDQNKDKKSKSDITTGLQGVLDKLSDNQLAQLSKHLSGEAFDVQPVTQDAEAIKKTIRGLTGLSKFLEREGGLVRWHAQF